MARIAIVCPISSLSAEEINERKNLLGKVAAPDTDISFIVCNHAPKSIESRFEEEIAAAGVIEECVRSQRNGNDAAIVWCAADPSVMAAREVVDIPVIGPGESALQIAYGLASSYSIVVPNTEHSYLTVELLKRLDLFSKFKSVRAVEMSVIEMRKDRDILLKAVVAASKKAVKEDGAHAIVLACLGMIGLADRITKAVGVPVIDPGFAAIAQAELFVRLGLRFSKRTYPTPAANSL